VSGLMDRVAGAPITWGVCEVPGWGYQLAPGRVLAEMAGIGLVATELGPEGFLPSDTGRLRELLAEHALRLVGGFLPIVLHVEEGMGERLAGAAGYADLLAGAGAEVLVLAAAASGDGYEAAPELDRDEWNRLVRGIDRVVELAGERGLAVAVHPHHGTAIERAADVERFLETSPASLCLDTGHLMVGGADPMEVAGAAAGRVAPVQKKDVSAEAAEQVRTGRSGYAEAVRAGLYRPLGEGDLDITGIVRTLRESGYRGWYVLEQDTVLEAAPDEGAGPVLDASVSLQFLRRIASELDHDNPAESAGGTRAPQYATPLGREEGR
jgi:inosose dehydratase